MERNFVKKIHISEAPTPKYSHIYMRYSIEIDSKDNYCYRKWFLKISELSMENKNERIIQIHDRLNFTAYTT